MLWNLSAFLVALGILITVHEFGHFWVARRCGVHVERFCIGLGPPLWSYTDRKGTEYVVALIPLGGYIKMLGEQVGVFAISRSHEVFNNKSILQRAIIVSAGPIANFLFAIFAYWFVFIVGIPTLRPVIGEILPHSIAAKAEISSGMEFKSVNGIITSDWGSVRLALIKGMGGVQTKVIMLPPDSLQQVIKILDLHRSHFELNKQDPVLALGIIPRGPQIESVLVQVQIGSAAQRAGLHAGDKVIKINGQLLTNWQAISRIIQDSPGKSLVLEIERNNLPLCLTLIPDTKVMRTGNLVGFAGITPKVLPLPEEYKIIHQYGCFQALYLASDKIWQLIKLTAGMLMKLIIGDININSLGGPIAIAQGAGASADSGLVYYFMFLALISVNLGIINLFPLPVLDGGHLIFLAIERIKGSPVSKEMQEYSYRMGSIMLVLLMGLVLFNDFSRL